MTDLVYPQLIKEWIRVIQPIEEEISKWEVKIKDDKTGKDQAVLASKQVHLNSRLKDITQKYGDVKADIKQQASGHKDIEQDLKKYRVSLNEMERIVVRSV
jgi:formyltetrahydrofolate hydrolase